MINNSNANNDPYKSGPITPRHLRGLAVVYCRQSTPQQVRHHEGSAAAQRDLVDVALALGWPQNQILVVDEDQGLSGTSTAGRHGYLDLLMRMERDEVTLVLVQDLSRLSRKRSDINVFLETAEEKSVLVYASGALHDPASGDLAATLGLDIAGTFGSWDNRVRARRMREAKLAKARRGHAVSPAPVGYIRTSAGGWDKDPDRAVQQAIELAFDLYEKFGSLGKVVNDFRTHNLQFPRRRRGQLRWGPLDAALLHNVLRNRAYVGAYVFLRRQTKKRAHGGGVTVKFRPPHEQIEVLDHHEPYISRERWQRIQEMLAARRPRIRPLIGKGPGLLQGRLRCAACGRWMKTHYWGRNGVARTATYTCIRQNGWGQTTHKVIIPARYVEHAIVEHVLGALTAIDEDTAHSVIDRYHEEHATLEHAQRRRLLELDEDVDRLLRLLKSVPAELQPARNDLWAKYNEAVQHQLEVKTQLSRQTATSFSVTTADIGELIELTGNARGLWDAPQRTHAERKQLLEAVLEEILVHHADREGADLELVWKGGLRERVPVYRPRGLEAGVADRSREGKSARAIADELNTVGAVTASGQPITQELVAHKQGRRGLRLKDERGRARQIIWQGLLANVSRPDIRRQLEVAAPRLGPWTPQRLSDYIRDLRWRAPAGVDPLPPILPADEEQARVLAIIEMALRDGKTWTPIARLLNEAGHTPPRGKQFTGNQVRLLYLRSRRLKSLNLRALGSERRLPSDG